MGRQTKVLTLCIALIVFFAVPSAVKAGAGKTKIFVSILPQAYFVRQVGGAYVDVHVLVGPGQSPATYEPTPKQMARLSRSRVYFRIGTPFEKGFVDKIARIFKNLIIVDMRKNVSLRYFEHAGGLEVPDPHIWLDPKRVKIQARTIYETLSGIDPAHKTVFEKNLLKFQDDLERVDAKITAVLLPVRGRKLYVFHPSFGYFCDSYGLDQVAIEVEGKEPSPKQLSKLIRQAKMDGVGVVFVEPQFMSKDARAVASAIGATLVPLDPLPGEYITAVENMAEIIRTSFSKEHTGTMQ